MCEAPRRLVFLDIDDCLAGTIWPLADRPRQPVDRAVLAEILSECQRACMAVHLLTNRPPGQLAVLGHLIGGPARYHFAESGLSAWLPDENRAIVNPDYQDFADRVRQEVVQRLSILGLSWRGPIVEEFGTRLVTVTVFPLNGSSGDVERLVATVRDLLADLPVVIKQGK
ncbi:MAG: hypothetical protein H5T86_07015, partial [Armatimonadetes bacterium]|nr:hypothetical protein [Armatimonadota bacterium]